MHRPVNSVTKQGGLGGQVHMLTLRELQLWPPLAEPDASRDELRRFLINGAVSSSK